jgi:uncharacterized membrane-anchored protein
MPNSRRLLLVAFCLVLTVPSLRAQKAEAKLNILKGPAKASMATVARIDVPSGYSFLDGAGTRKLMKASGEPVSGNEMGMMAPTNGDWSVIFEFSDVGYVKDDEKDKLDADKLLASFRSGTAEQNKERQRNGQPPLEIIGWEQPPQYDPVTHNLEWAIRASSAGRPILNYNTRLLGRKGVMEIVLIVEPESLPAALPKFKSLLANYSFQSGESYAEYKPGDKVAAYGLTALVVGGAAVGAAKLGLFAGLAVLLKKAWKLVVVAVVAVAAVFKKIFARLTGRGDNDTAT